MTPVVGPNDPQPPPRHQCPTCGAGYYGEAAAETCHGLDVLEALAGQ